jgi:hypothetical protein
MVGAEPVNKGLACCKSLVQNGTLKAVGRSPVAGFDDVAKPNCKVGRSFRLVLLTFLVQRNQLAGSRLIVDVPRSQDTGLGEASSAL